MSDGDRDDPFAHLGEQGDREGDPFERLDAPDEAVADADGDEATDEERTTDRSSTADAVPDSPFGDREADAVTDSVEPADDAAQSGEASSRASDGDPLSTDEADPFSGMSQRGGNPFETGESVFEAVDVGSVDADEVWASLAEDDDGGETAGVTRHADVSKHRYCEQCEHFSGPPEVRCTRESTEIVEFLDMETVRLLNCPVVAEQRELGNEE